MLRRNFPTSMATRRLFLQSTWSFCATELTAPPQYDLLLEGERTIDAKH